MTEATLTPSRTLLAPVERTLDTARAVLVLAMLHAVLAAAAFAVLTAAFGFPGILREPGGVVLEAFNRNPGIIRTAYYAFTLSSVLYVPVAILLRRAMHWNASALVDVAAGFGILAGFAQVLGFSRWPLYVPVLADAYAAAAPGSATRETMILLYEAANRYSGMTVGEHLGWLFQGLWMVCLAIAMVRQRADASWLGWLGAALGAALLISSAEQFQAGLEGPLGLLNSVATTALPFWMIGAGIWLVRRAAELSEPST